MKTFYRISFFLFALSIFGLHRSVVATAATTPILGTATTYGVLARTYTNPVPGTTINGDVGFSVGPAVVPSGAHANYGSGGSFSTAGTAQSAAVTSLGNQPCTFTFPAGIIDLATDTTHGTMGVYAPGVYCVSSMVPGIVIGAGGITLSGSGVYIFRVNGSLTTVANSHVTLANGASACDVFWTLTDNVITSTLGANSLFSGTLIDTVGLAIRTNVSWTGRALLFNGRVSTDIDDTITVPSSCTLPQSPDVLRVVKTVINDNGGTAVASDFTIHVKGSGAMGIADVTGSPAVGVPSPGREYMLMANTYVVSEGSYAGYTTTYSGDCDASGNVIVGLVPKTCTVTNDDSAVKAPPPPAPKAATLRVVKIVINNNAGSAISADAVIHVASSSGDVAESPKPGAAFPGTSYVLDGGTYTVSEDFFAGYTMSIGGDCSAGGTVVLSPGDDKTCMITNNDIAGVSPPTTPPNPPPSNPPSAPPSTEPLCDVCSRLTYDVYIINPDGSQRHTGTPWVKVASRGKGIMRYSFEDATIDPHNPLFDHNDSVIDVDLKDCTSVTFMFVSSDASWKHQVRIKVLIDGVAQSDTLVVNDSKAVVGTSKIVHATTTIDNTRACLLRQSPLNGRILLQTQAHGEAWYVRPESGLRYYMKNGFAAYTVMRNFGSGITDVNLNSIPSAATVDELKKSKSACSSNSTARKMKGKILLQVQHHGEAWYVDPGTCRRIYLRDGLAAYTVMRFLGLGITDANLAMIRIGQ